MLLVSAILPLETSQYQKPTTALSPLTTAEVAVTRPEAVVVIVEQPEVLANEPDAVMLTFAYNPPLIPSALN